MADVPLTREPLAATSIRREVSIVVSGGDLHHPMYRSLWYVALTVVSKKLVGATGGS